MLKIAKNCAYNLFVWDSGGAHRIPPKKWQRKFFFFYQWSGPHESIIFSCRCEAIEDGVLDWHVVRTELV